MKRETRELKVAGPETDAAEVSAEEHDPAPIAGAQLQDAAENAQEANEARKLKLAGRFGGWFRSSWLGIVLCLAIAVPAWFLGKLVPVVGSAVFAILFGLLIALFRLPAACNKGVKFVSKKVLQSSIVFLGFGMNFITVLEVGQDSLLIILATIGTALITSYLLTKLLRIPAKTGVLIGVGSSICGGSAIAATAPVIEAEDSDVARSISVIFLFNVVAAFLFPVLGRAFGMSDIGFGMWAGTAINDTSSVVAAGQSWASYSGSDTALQYATIVKLTRTLAIIPITLVLALFRLRKAKKAAKTEGSTGNVALSFRFGAIFPWFVLFFMLAAVVNTWLFPVFGWTASVSSALSTVGKFLITLAMAAIGLNTNLIQLIKKGGKPILLGLICWVAIAAVGIGMQVALGLW